MREATLPERLLHGEPASPPDLASFLSRRSRRGRKGEEQRREELAALRLLIFCAIKEGKSGQEGALLLLCHAERCAVAERADLVGRELQSKADRHANVAQGSGGAAAGLHIRGPQGCLSSRLSLRGLGRGGRVVQGALNLTPFDGGGVQRGGRGSEGKSARGGWIGWEWDTRGWANARVDR
jgi:hypothetical protein